MVLQKYNASLPFNVKLFGLLFIIIAFVLNLFKLTTIRWAGYFCNAISLLGAILLIFQMNSYYQDYRE